MGRRCRFTVREGEDRRHFARGHRTPWRYRKDGTMIHGVTEKRTRRRLPTPGMVERYPTPFAGSRKLKRMSRVAPQNPEDGYPRQLRCAQCGFPIADWAAIQRCPNCDSDNFVGKNLRK